MNPHTPPPQEVFGKNTRLALDNFDVTTEPMPAALLRALLSVKRCAAPANAARADATHVSPEIAAAIVAVCEDLEKDLPLALFPVSVFQTGSGTSTNMNVNEVVAALATRLAGMEVHPNDHVNASQSTNDVFPSALRIAALTLLDGLLVPSLQRLASVLRERSVAFADVVKAGRTHHMDATPITLGQEFGGYAAQVEEAVERLQSCRERVGRLPLGGTAVGTGINAPAGFAADTIAALAAGTGLPLREAPDHFAVQAGQDSIVELSGHVRTAAVALFKIAGDIRLLASGPRTGIAELRLPELQPGSSIMPGKVNPVLCEVVTQVAVQVMGNDTAVAFAGSQGQFELNAYLPLLARNLLESITLLGRAARSFADRCVASIEADEERCRAYAESTPALATALNTAIGYDAATSIVREAQATGRRIIEVARDRGVLDDEQLTRVLDPLAMTHARPADG